MNKFRGMGFIDYNGHLEVHSSLLSVVLNDQPNTCCEAPATACSRAAGRPRHSGFFSIVSIFAQSWRRNGGSLATARD